MASLVWLLGTAMVFAQAPASVSSAEKIIALYKKGGVALEAKDFNGAITAFNEIIALEPRAARAYLGRAIAYHRAGVLDKALADYEQAGHLGKNVQALLNQGAIHVDKGHYDKALAVYTEAVQLDPANTQIYYRRAMVYEQLGNYDKCLADYDEIWRREGGSAFLYTCRANAHVRFHHYDRARVEYLAAASQNGNQAEAYNGLAWLLATCPRAEIRYGKVAVYYARKACEMTSWKVDTYLDTLAAACAEAGDFTEAVQWERKALETVEEPKPAPLGIHRIEYIPRVKLTKKERAEAQQRLKLYEQHRAYREP